MAWSKAQLAEAKRMYKKPGNKKTWAACIAAATKGGKKKTVKKHTVSGVGKVKKASKKSSPKVVIVRKAKTVKIAGVGSFAMSGFNTALGKLHSMDKEEIRLRSCISGSTGAQKKLYQGQLKKLRSMRTGVNQHKNFFKRFL